MNYRREIDGLRAVAVVPVILFHAGFPLFSGGFIGVGVFFVISGYLITSILVAEREAGVFSIARFYERRARRILPALLVVMFVCVPIAWFTMLPSDVSDFTNSVVAVSAFSSNFLFWKTSGYFDTANELKPLLHTWSLAVEEQYYLLFPVLLVLFWNLGRRRMMALFAVLGVISLVMAQRLSTTQPATAFYLLPTRGWELLVGVLTALHFQNKPDTTVAGTKAIPWEELMGVLGFALITYAVFAFDRQTPFPGVYALIPTVGTALLILFASQRTLVGKLLGCGPLVGIGLISYSAYLWHQPLFAFVRYKSVETPDALTLNLLSLLAFAMAYVSWRYVEQPFRRRLSKGALFRSLGASYAAMLSLAAAMFVFLPRQYDGVAIAPINAYGGERFEWDGRDAKSPRTVSYVLYGDSHARQYLGALNELANERDFSLSWMLHPACMSLPGIVNIYSAETRESCVKMLQTLQEKLGDSKSDLIVAYRWSKNLERVNGEKLGFVEKSQTAQDELLSSLAQLRHWLPPERRLIVIGNVPTTNLIKEGGYLKCLVKRGAAACPALFPAKDGELFRFNRRLRRFAQRSPNTLFLNPYDALCSQNRCLVRSGEKLIYSDHAHLSAYGAELVIRHFSDTFQPR